MYYFISYSGGSIMICFYVRGWLALFLYWEIVHLLFAEYQSYALQAIVACCVIPFYVYPSTEDENECSNSPHFMAQDEESSTGKPCVQSVSASYTAAPGTTASKTNPSTTKKNKKRTHKKALHTKKDTPSDANEDQKSTSADAKKDQPRDPELVNLDTTASFPATKTSPFI